ncbi:MAG: hypothetical protein ACOVP4_02125 [Bacteriovoracaceae bacterium]
MKALIFLLLSLASFSSFAQKKVKVPDLALRTHEELHYAVKLFPLNNFEDANAGIIFNGYDYANDKYVNVINVANCTEKNTGEMNCEIVENITKKPYAVHKIDIVPGKKIKVTHVNGHVQYVHVKGEENE